MRRRSGRKTGILSAGTALICMVFAAAPANAHARHRHHAVVSRTLAPRAPRIVRHNAIPAARTLAVPAPVDAGFGPTAPGVSAIVIDAASGNVISAVGADIPRYPASLTKLMVLDLAFQALRDHRMTLDTQIPVSSHAASVEPVKLGLRPGDTISVEQAILSMTTMSANDAATALGEYLGGGSEYRCGQEMTLRAHALGMAQSQFYNASGLPNPNQITTARDLAILARDIVESYPEDQGFFEVQKFDFNGRIVYSNNQMLKLYPGATGMKTGYTTLAKHNLVTSAVRNGRTLIGVVLHEPSWGQTYQQMTAMLDGGFGNHIGPATGAQLALNSPAPAPAPPAFQPAPPHPNLFASAPAAPARNVSAETKQRAAPAFSATYAGWTAQIGPLTKLARARTRAIEVAHMRGVGVPRVARVEHHGHILYTAQLAGLTQTAAHETCSALAARRTSCIIIPPQADHMASLEDGNS
jgi:D-alanyl-D-alanine carboxypeptidase